jgi:long-chain fatty acid transport protein
VKRALICFGLIVFAPAARANPLDAYGFGARGIALGGAMTAAARGFAATYYNPAGLAIDQPLSLELGYVYSEPTLRIDGRDLEVDASQGFQGGITVPGDIYDRAFAVSLGLHLPDGLISRVRSLPQGRPRFVLYDNRPQRLVVSTSAAFEIFDGLYFGAGLTYIASTKGGLDVTGVVNASDASRTELLSAVDVTFSSVRYPTFGVVFAPYSDLRLGLTYRHEFSLELELGVRVRGDITIGEEDLLAVENASFALSSYNTDLFSPRQVALGGAWDIFDDTSIYFDLTWLDWSRFPPPVSAIDLVLDLGDLDFEVPIPDAPLPAEFHDIFVPRLGVEWRMYEEVALRAGYAYEPSPAPDQPGTTNYVDSNKHQLSIGLGLRLDILPGIFPRPLIFDFAFSKIFLVDRDYVKTDPADPIGDYRAGGRVHSAAATLSLELE